MGLFLIPATGKIFAETVDELKTRIDDRASKIAELEADIKKYQEQLQEVGKQKQTLQQAVQTIDISRKKISTDIKITENRIQTTADQIAELSYQIGDKETTISKDISAVKEALRSVELQESNSNLETFLAHDSLSDYWDSLESLEAFQGALRSDIVRLVTKKEELEGAKKSTEEKKQTLTSLQNQLGGQKSLLDNNRREKDALLAQTKNQESNYQKTLAEKKKAKEQFEKELADYESKLKFALDPSSIPKVGAGVLSWPFETTYMQGCTAFQGALGNANCVTQMFGNTAFAKAGAYSGKGHNGIDFRAPTGTKILAVLSGTVIGTGNTDEVRGCYSYGKWVLVRHGNGLTSLYAHLSYIGVSEGQAVSTGDSLGFSGATGYATGPHLHFGLYASPGVKIIRLTEFTGKSTPCGNVKLPVAGLEAYLNPLLYL